jgi:hypothetical protein
LEATAVRASGVIAALENGPDDAKRTGLRHDLRSRLGTLRAALDVLPLAPAGGTLAQEARAIAQRHAAQLETSMNELLGGTEWEPH